ncbi:MAG: electron transfer flavoprotein subunit alpha/FixB family protein [Syntrophales bacterium]|nr:electron transfer flavoprotein subunit alpha/FixB family protein [Syntrophales bacterium]
MKEHKGVWVFAEQRGGKLSDVGLELLGIGRKIADKQQEGLAAVLMGHKVKPLVDELGEYGADRVYLADNPLLEVYRSDAYGRLMQEMIQQYKPNILIMGATSIGADLAPRVAAKVNTGLSAHCVGFDVDDKGQFVGQVPGFGGAVMASVICPNHYPQMATARPGFFEKLERQKGRKTEAVNVDVKFKEEDLSIKVVGTFREEVKTRPLESADVVVAGGYGVGGKENWKLVEELAEVLGGGVGATRPPCDEGWADLEGQMIGQSGKTVRPSLYIGVGISGAMHHLVGIKDTKVVVAINKDPNAPIFQAADYGIVGDLCQIIPRLVEAMRVSF